MKEEKELTKQEKEFFRNLEVASQIVMLEDEELLKELGKV